MIKNNIVSSKKKLLMALFISVSIVAGYIIISPQCGDPTHDHSAEENSGEQLYTCSMHPQIRSTNPNDKCPICGMSLIPVESGDDLSEDGDADADEFKNSLRLSARAIALAGIQTAPAISGSLSYSITLSGRIEYDETRLRTIAARIPGRLDRLRVDYTGAVVRKGTILADIYSPALLAAQQELLHAARQADQPGPDFLTQSLKENFNSSKEKLRLLGLSSRQIEGILSRGQTLEHVYIEAPLNGIVIDLQVKQGVYVETGQPLYTLADLSSVWVQLEAYEADLQHLARGQKVSLSVEGIPGKNYEGRISFIDPVLNSLTRTSRVRVELPNMDGRLRPGMFARGELSGSSQRGILVPASAPLITGRRALVYIQLPGDIPRFEAREVKLGPRIGDNYIVTGGLSHGDIVVVHGAFKIDSELQIRGRPSMMSSGGGKPQVHDHGTRTVVNEAQMPGTKTDVSKAAAEIDFAPLLNAYEKAWKALASDDLKGWQNAVESMQRQVSGSKWPDSYSSSRKNLLQGSGHISHVASLEDARVLFEVHSKALIRLVRSGHLDKTWYIVFCPMAFDDKGAEWLQNEKEISNPYFGPAMLRCGEIKSEIKGKGGN